MKQTGRQLLQKLNEKIQKRAMGNEEWPPTCLGVFYQPKRPVAGQEKE